MMVRRILVLLDAQHFGRSITRGILLHARAHPGWQCHVEGWAERSAWESGALERFDGIIALVRSEDMAERLLACGRPVVNVSNFAAGRRLPSVLTDDQLAGGLGARSLLARGWRHLAFAASIDACFVRERLAGFAGAATEMGAELSVLLPAAGRPAGAPPGLAAFLAGLPRPAAVMGANDYSARHVALAANEAGIAIPAGLGLLGVDDDGLVCELSSPPLASIALDGVAHGQAAAVLLDRLIAGEAAPAEPIRIPPLRLVPRLSCDAIAIDDPELSAAWACIRARALHGIGVDEVVAAVHLSRSVLEKRFLAAFGTTIGVELRRLRLDEVRRLLADSDLPLGRIARACGFSNAKQMGAAFVADGAETPSAWRARHRASDPARTGGS